MTAIPTSQQELEDLLSDRNRVEQVAKDGGLAELVKNYARAVHQKDSDISAQIREQSQAVLAEMLKADKKDVARLNMSPGATGNAKGYNAKAPGAAVDREFENPADFFQAIWHNSGMLNDAAGLQAKRDKVQKIQASYSSTVPADGGFLIPEQFRSELLQVSLEDGVVRPRARVIPMESLRTSLPMIDSTSNSGSVFGGIVAYWTEEGAALTESQATFGRVVLDAKKLTTYCEAPNELVADATAFGAFFSQTFPQAMAWYEDKAFISGTGVGEPLGFLNNAAVASVAKETGQAAGTIVWENVVKAYSRMLPSSLNRAVWLASPDTFPELATMALSVGTGGSAVWLNNGSQGPAATILGRPVIFTEKLPTVGTTGDLVFADLSYYLIGDRQVMQAMSSPHYKFANDKTAFRIISRVDGRPWLNSAITPSNGSSNTLSPFVQVATR